MAGQSAIRWMTGIQVVFNTTNISLTPLVDVRSARISCTSQRNPALGEGDVEAADGVEAEGMGDLDIIDNGPPLQCGVVL